VGLRQSPKAVKKNLPKQSRTAVLSPRQYHKDAAGVVEVLTSIVALPTMGGAISRLWP
jgi:hypothetical protein